MKLKGERVASDLLKELSMILLTDAKDEDFKYVTLTYATVTNDLSTLFKPVMISVNVPSYSLRYTLSL